MSFAGRGQRLSAFIRHSALAAQLLLASIQFPAVAVFRRRFVTADVQRSGVSRNVNSAKWFIFLATVKSG